MKNLVFIFITLLSFNAISQSYTNAESVERDAANNRWLVANGSNIIIDDGNGNLSFFGNASASHGMEIVGDILFAIDSNVVKGYMLDDASEVMSLTIPGVGFLNGMGSDAANQILYISDFGNNKIFSVDVSDVNNPTFEEIVSNTGGTPNGVLYDGATNNRLLFVTWGANAKIRQVDLTDFSVSDVVSNTGVGNIDGIVYDDVEDAYLISSWSPARIIKYTDDFSTSFVIISSGISAPADLGIDTGNQIIGIPIGNDVVFTFTVPTTGVNEFDLSTIGFKLSKNPIQDNSYVEFTLDSSAQMAIELFNIEGKKVASILESTSVIGYNRIAIPYSGLSSGTYFLHVTMDGRKQIMKLLAK